VWAWSLAPLGWGWGERLYKHVVGEPDFEIVLAYHRGTKLGLDCLPLLAARGAAAELHTELLCNSVKLGSFVGDIGWGKDATEGDLLGWGGLVHDMLLVVTVAKFDGCGGADALA
jgi:hypothetical protein